MKLRARIERSSTRHGKVVTLTFPKGIRPYTPEAIVTRNLGPRPWSEISLYRDNGDAVRIYAK